MKILCFCCQPLLEAPDYPIEMKDPADESGQRTAIKLSSRTVHMLYRQVLLIDSHLIIICPGAPDDVRQVRDNIIFNAEDASWKRILPWTFVADINFALTRSLGLFAADQWSAWPAILKLHPANDGLILEELLIGRGSFYYGHEVLIGWLLELRKMAVQRILPSTLNRLDKWLAIADHVMQNNLVNHPRSDSPTCLPHLPGEIRSEIFKHMTCRQMTDTVLTVDRIWCRYVIEYLQYRLGQLRARLLVISDSSASTTEITNLCCLAQDEINPALSIP